MEKNMEHEMETGVIQGLQDMICEKYSPQTLNPVP